MIGSEWSPAAGYLVDWFRANRGRLAQAPFELCPGSRVVEPETFYRSLEMDIKRGPDGPRAAALETSLQNLRRVTDGD